MRTLSLYAIILLLSLATAHAADLSGGWSGTWTKDGDALPVTMTFAESGGG